jgi:hypothetical protein
VCVCGTLKKECKYERKILLPSTSTQDIKVCT